MVETALRKHVPRMVSVKSVCAHAAVNGDDPPAGQQERRRKPAA